MAVDNQKLTSIATAQNEVASAMSPSKGDVEEQKEARMNKITSPDAQSNADENDN